LEEVPLFKNHGRTGASSTYFSSKAQTREEQRREEAELGELKYARLPAGNYSRFVVTNLERVGRLEGVDAMQRVLSQPDVDLHIVDGLLCFAVASRGYWQAELLGQFAGAFSECVSRRLGELSEEAIRATPKWVVNQVLSRLDTLLNKVWSASRSSQYIEQMALVVALKYFKSRYLDCRVQGLNDLREVIAAVRSMNDYQKRKDSSWTFSLETPPKRAYRWITTEHLVSWLEEHGILEQCLAGEAHPELLRRTTDLIIFYAQEELLAARHLELLWKASRGVHESVETIVYRIVVEVSPSLTATLLDHLYHLMRQILIKDYDEAYLAILGHITAHGINLAQAEGRPAWYGINDFWTLMMDESGVDAEVTQPSVKHTAVQLEDVSLTHSLTHSAPCHSPTLGLV